MAVRRGVRQGFRRIRTGTADTALTRPLPRRPSDSPHTIDRSGRGSCSTHRPGDMSSTDNALAVLLGGRRLGTLTETNDRLTLVYDQDYQADAGSTPLSISMPVTHRPY